VFNEGVISRIKPSGTLILNTWKCPADIHKEYPFGDRKVTIITSDLTQIAFDKKLTTTENHPIVNTTVVGLITKTAMKITMSDVKNALEHTFGSGKKTEQNFTATQLAVDRALVEFFPINQQKESK
jgi:Pyruvate/2-oxoacid:ferredoxin oxidoreductase gamma subunit